MQDDATHVTAVDGLSKAHMTGFSLRDERGGEIHLSLQRTHLPELPGVCLVFTENQLVLEMEPAAEVTVNGDQVKASRILERGDVIIALDSRFTVHYEPVLAFLESLTPPHRGSIWPLTQGTSTIGRPGRRVNTIPLQDQTVSREQASLQYVLDRFVVVPESAASTTTVNGRPINGKAVLRNGDLIGCGQQVLRFQSTHDAFGTRQGSVFFCDVWDYSSLFHARPVHQVAEQMKQFYELAGSEVEEHGGLVLRYIGDALLAAFSEEDHADAAVAAGRALHRGVAGLNRLWKSRGNPEFRVGVGINSGEFALGHMGFAGYIEFGALGADVNMAARIEKLTRETGAKVLLGESTYSLLRQKEGLYQVGEFALKGVEQPIIVYEADVIL